MRPYGAHEIHGHSPVEPAVNTLKKQNFILWNNPGMIFWILMTTFQA